MEQKPKAAPAATGGDDLLVAQQSVTAARSRLSTPSDTTCGKSDGND
ncbi:hypothetical protein [Streptomyces sp. NPDC088554]